MITGGSHAELPLIRSLHALGYFVISTGMNTEGLGHREADLYIPADFSDRESVLTIAKEQKVAGIVSGCNDFAYLSAAYACDKLGLPGHDSPETAERIHHKDAFRSLLKAQGLPYPAFQLCRNYGELKELEERLNLPVVVKPTDLTGGKGVAVCHTWEQARRQFEIAIGATRQDAVLVEEYIEGSNHGVSLLLQNGKVRFSFFDNEEYWLNPYLVSGAYSPSDLEEETKEEIRRQIEIIAQAEQLCDGLFHCQCIVKEDKTPFLIDPCRRAPGDLYIQLVSYATGIDYPMAIVKNELGLSASEELSFTPQQRNIARECIMSDQNGIIEGFTIAPEYERHIIHKLQWGRVGDRIEDYMKYKAGIVFFSFSDAEEMREKMRTLYKNMRINVRKEKGE